MRNKSKDIAVTGFALFSMFFGAGNLLFPPYLGLVSGQSWIAVSYTHLDVYKRQR